MTTQYTVTDRGAIMLRGAIRKPGETILASEFKGVEAARDSLVASGNLATGPVQVTGLDIIRGEQLPPIPASKDDKAVTEDKMPRLVPGDNKATLAKLAEIKARQAEAAQADAERQSVMADVEGVELDIEEARALRIVS